jgi:hypothetical protein
VDTETHLGEKCKKGAVRICGQFGRKSFPPLLIVQRGIVGFASGRFNEIATYGTDSPMQIDLTVPKLRPILFVPVTRRMTLLLQDWRHIRRDISYM